MTLTTDSGTSLGLVDSYTGGTEHAATSRIYASEGRRITRRTQDPRYQRDLTEALRLYERVLGGNRRAALDFQESMSRSDFQFLFGDVIDRQLLAFYNTMPVNWDITARRGRVRDFRTVKRFTLDGGRGVLSEVGELAPYKARAVVDGAYEYSVKKYGAEIPISWETVVNDDLDALSDLPSTLGLAARRTEERFATALYASSSGPNSTFFSNAHKNVINPTVGGAGVTVTNPALSVSALQVAMQIMGQQVDSDGGPIYVQSVVLEVPPALEVVANNIVNSTEILSASGGGDGTGNDQLRVQNWMRNRVTVRVNPWLPLIDTTTGNSAWYLFASPSSGRPAMEVGFLIGHETPELWMKSPDAVRVGGGPVAPEEGDFEHDGIRYRVRHVLGGTPMDHKMAIASTGTSS
ncbi:hypothetical protein Ssi03_50580 [Sphaerisporangium siamense]|uniref:Bacteriophage Mu GpT domain-containing protein n=1 Tax=Sphaerisporangium siamense TaxID=795645 RepID=A0A7W7D8G8_9ACTN|nr:hypothetical protein [Sphaerisporangium siamense]MBB4702238.1 hypothetical protein [Sphaerisporangium siamense]GII87068.1 hypothetical protein Ssi03_50580 [Sphaerisporangium siamense]